MRKAALSYRGIILVVNLYNVQFGLSNRQNQAIFMDAVC